MRRIIQIISVLFLAVMVGAVLVIKNLDINSYREQIQKLVADKTDHQLLLNGELKLSLFPIAIYAQDVAILQTSQANKSIRITIPEAQMSLQLLPLLRGQFKTNKVTLQQPSIHFVTLDNDTANGNSKPSTATAFAPPDIVRQIIINGADLTWEDRANKRVFAIENFNLEMDAFEVGKPAEVVMSGTMSEKDTTFRIHTTVAVHSSPPTIKTTGFSAQMENAQLTAMFKTPQIRYQLDNNLSIDTPHLQLISRPQDVSLDITLAELNYDGLKQLLSATKLDINGHYDTLPVTIQSARLSADIATQNLRVDTLNLAIDTLNGQLNALHIQNFLHNPQLNTNLSVDTFDARSLLPGNYSGDNHKAFSSISANGRIRGTMDTLEITNLQVDIDESRINGWVKLKDFTHPEVSFNLATEKLSIDRYLPQQDTDEKNASIDALEPPPISLNGSLKIQHLIARNIPFNNVELTFQDQDDNLTVDAKARFYQGTVTSNLHFDRTSKHTTLNSQIDQVMLGQLLSDFGITEQVSGIGSLDAQLQMHSNNGEQNRFGEIKLTAQNGQIKGVNITHFLDAIKKITGQVQDTTAWQGTNNADDFTEFKKLSASFKVNNDIIQSNDLKLQSQLLDLAGNGNINLASQTLDYAITVTINDNNESSALLKRFAGQPIPVQLSGDLNAPQWSIDLKTVYQLYAQAYLGKKLGATSQVTTDIIDSISQSDKPLSEEDSQQDKNQLIEDILRRLVQ